ncbi:MAG TPA: DUF1570 domain-containing protein [Phycisphaerae bacterium]|nr:DUF1570 domain-containing protein [Phycisphaerae bacterium]
MVKSVLSVVDPWFDIIYLMLRIHPAVVLSLIVALLGYSSIRADTPVLLTTYNPPGYYTIHTDENLDITREIWLHMNFVAQSYEERLHDIFGGSVTQKLPFYIFTNPADYYAAGAPAGSAGVFMINYVYGDQRLMAIGGDQITHEMWHILQHEGFHQFTYAMIGGYLPPWANEGLAEYFGDGLFTGDNFMTGWIDPDRLARLKYEIQNNMFKSIHDMRELSYDQWNDVLMGVNYDQAWSMIYFLAWANHQRYAQPFTQYLILFHNGMPSDEAWDHIFGANSDADFQRLWRQYWLNMPDDPTAQLFAKAQTATLTSFLARAYMNGQRFSGMQEFIQDATNGSLKLFQLPSMLWLPNHMLQTALENAADVGEWGMEFDPQKQPCIICQMPDGTRLVGRFELGDNRINAVIVTVVPSDQAQKPSDPLETVGNSGG